MYTKKTKILSVLMIGVSGLQCVAHLAEAEEIRTKRGVMMTNPIGKLPDKAAEKPPAIDTRSFSAPKEYVLPPLKESGQKGASLAEQQQVMIKTIVVTGNTVLPDTAIQNVTAPYTNRLVALSELFELRDKLTRLYINKGYVTSGVVMKDQDVTDGRLVLNVVEGRLTDITVHGNQALRSNFISDRIANGLTAPLNVSRLEERLQLLRQRDMIRTVKSELRPGLKAGDASLDVEVEEASPFFANVSYHNHSSPNLGATKGEVQLGWRSMLGWDDKLTVGYGNTHGVNDYALSYEIPFTVADTTLKLTYSNATSEVVAEPFTTLGIISKTKSYGVALRHPFIKESGQELAGSLGLQHRASQTFLLGEPYDFTKGTENGRSAVSTINLGQEWIVRGASQVVALHSEFSKGVGCCGAKVLPGEPNGNFLAWLGQAQWVKALPSILDSQVIAKGAIRLTDNPMLTTEKFALGGADTVRGYRENLLSRDQGGVASVEWRVPTTLSMPVPFVSELASYGGLTGAVFYDYGRAKDKGVAVSPPPDDISSVGVGLLWSISKNSNAEIYLADRLRNVPDFPNQNAQDRGIHFRLNIATD
ncbi:MAG: BamA/TamA family outer membrane protein [Magnetococcus sp. YQC-5]